METTERSEDGRDGLASRLKSSTAAWAALVAVVAFLPVVEAVVPGRVFFLRDLHTTFWRLHLWFRREVFRGGSLLWDPFSGLGQSAIVDPLRHVLFPPVAAVRLLLPETLGFNMTVALPFPVAAVGMLLFLRERLGLAASALGGLVFALSGPMLSTGNMPNLSWSAALAPWSLWAVSRLARGTTAPRFFVAAAALALQFLAAEPVTLAATAAIATAYALATEGRRAAAVTVGAGLCGFLLAAAQAFPTIRAGVASGRSGGGGNTWGVHPLALVELVVPQLFGDFANARQPDRVWLNDMYAGGVPLMFSVYVGAAAVGLAVLALAGSRDRVRTWFWTAVFGSALVCSLGSATPVYPALRAVVPVLNYFRWPSKYTLVAALAVAALAALGFETLLSPAKEGSRVRLFAPQLYLGLLAAAAAAGLVWAAAAPADGPKAAFLARSIQSEGPVVLLVAVALAALLKLATSADAGRARLARALVFAVVAADLLAAGVRLNPTIDRAYFDPPEWVKVVQADPDARVFLWGHGADVADIDLGFAFPDDDRTWVAGTYAVHEMQLLPQAAGLGVREAWTSDPQALRPKSYVYPSYLFWTAPPVARARALERIGARYQVVPFKPLGAGEPLARAGADGELALYETPALARATVAPAAAFVPDTDAQFDVLVSMSRPVEEGVVQITGEEPPAAGVPGAPEGPRAAVVSDLDSAVRVDASAPEGGGYLRLLDGFDPDWVATVDGAPAPVLRADGLFRAVRVAPGRHEVVFTYRPRAFYAGCAVSAVTLLGLLAALALGRRRRA